LLLDRHRNVIITDFGFANQFAATKDDLMATSCGSPCYAAPELVVSDGLYVGSAVDIWSCGVILYAMLCGYLPFDDDPANPDGENINLLYRYILNTPLMFPSHIGSDARDLLRIMLVPDPRKRCSIVDIMKHRWLKDYRDLFNTTLDQLEADAMGAVERATPVTVTNTHHTEASNDKTEEAPAQVVPSNETQVQGLAISDGVDMMNISGISLEDHHVPSSPESNYADAMEDQENSLEANLNAVHHYQQPLLDDKIDTPVSVYQTPLDAGRVDMTSQEKTLSMDMETSDSTTQEFDNPPPASPTQVSGPSVLIEKELPDTIPSSDMAMKDPEQQSNIQQHSDSRRASAIPTSILQSRFLSSMQRSQSAGVASTTTNSTTSNNDSSRTVSFIMQPKPDTPVSARSAGAKPSSQASSSLFARGTRRKALSLLTRPTSDLDDDMTPDPPRARRDSSIRPAGNSQTVRLIVNGAPKGPTEQITKWGSVTLVPSLSERPVALDQKPKTKGFMEWFRKKAHGESSVFQ
jgi:serine/threonine protein kinase